MLLNKKEKNDFKFVALSGQDSVGMNCYAYCFKDQWIIVDLGIGLDKRITTEQILPDVSFLKDKNVIAVLLTHWHEDHMGAIAYYWKELFKGKKVPLYCSPIACEKIKRDIVGEAGVDSKLKINFQLVKPEGETKEVGDFKIQFIHSTHLTPQSFMIALKTEVGTVLHTGDWSFSPAPLIEPRTDFDSLKALNKENLLAVVGDSTEVYRKSETWGENVVQETMLKAMKQYNKKIFITLFSSSTARMESIFVNAKKVGRKVCLRGRSIIENFEIAQTCGFLKDCKFIKEEEEALKLNDNEVIYVFTGCQGEPLASMMKLVNDNLKDITLNPEDAVIFSSSIIPGNEKDVLYLYGKVVESGAHLFTINDDDTIHTHGHGGYSEFIDFYKNIIKPKAILPIHGDKLSQFLHMKLAHDMNYESFMFNNGDVICFYSDKMPMIIEKIAVGSFVLEGNREINIDDAIFKNRRKVFYDGAVFATICINKDGYLTDKPQISSLGVFEGEDNNLLKREIEISIVNQMKELGKGKQKSLENLTQAIATGIRKSLKTTNKKPKIVVHFVNK